MMKGWDFVPVMLRDSCQECEQDRGRVSSGHREMPLRSSEGYREREEFAIMVQIGEEQG